MDAEYKDMNESAPIPSLTLEPELENTPKLVVAEETKLQQSKVAEPVLTPQEQQMVDDFAQKIDVENTAQILQYGAGTQKKMADFSDAALANVRTQDLGEVGDLIVNVVGELKGFDAEEEKGFLGFFRKQANKLEVMKNRYAKAEVNVEKIGDALQQHQVRLLKDSAMLDKMYEQNLAYFKELTMYILAGKKKLQEVREGKLRELEATAQATGLAEDAQAAKDLADKCNRFEKKIYDLELTRTISIQTAPQIRMIQNNDNVMVEKIQTTLMNTIPLWKNQMVLALGIAHSNEAAQAQRQVDVLLRRKRDTGGMIVRQHDGGGVRAQRLLHQPAHGNVGGVDAAAADQAAGEHLASGVQREKIHDLVLCTVEVGQQIAAEGRAVHQPRFRGGTRDEIPPLQFRH